MSTETESSEQNPIRERSFIILLVDDDQDCRSFMRDAIDELGVPHQVIERENGKDAVDLLFSCDETNRPDLIFLDLEMPLMGGLETLEMVKAHPRLKSIPVIILSGVADKDIIERAALLGANSYTVKPNRVDEFIAVVSATAAYWLTVHQFPGRHSSPASARR